MPMCVETATETPLPFVSRSYGEHAVETTCTSAQYMRLDISAYAQSQVWRSRFRFHVVSFILLFILIL